MSLTPQEGNERERVFIAECQSSSLVWLLMLDGGYANWAEEGSTVVPAWSSEAEARSCRVSGLERYVPTAMKLDEFVGSFLPQLAQRGAWVAVQPTAEFGGNQLPADRMAAILCEDDV